MKNKINLIDPGRAAETAKQAAGKIPDGSAQLFFTKNVARWLRRRHDCLCETRPLCGDPDWVFQAQHRGHMVQRFALSPGALHDLNLLGDWLLAVLDNIACGGQACIEAKRTLNGLHAMSVDDALKKATAWHHAELSHQDDAPPRGPNGYQTTPLYKVLVSGGYVWEKLPVSDLVFLGHDLQNCMRTGKYQRDVTFRIMSVWGLRDPGSQRFVVALTTPGQSHSIMGVRGFRNAYPMDYKRQIRDFIQVLRSPSCDTPDLHALGLYPR
ncbi:MAG: hypothetical protein JKY27_05805 [Magnetovibrio sp.]|nr:hypothetical protein [Magnetovibrio sp.]